MAEGTFPLASEAAGEDTLAPLRADLDPAAFREIVSLYRATMTDRAGALEAAARKGDLDGVRRNAHDLAGMCGQLGAARAQTLARRVEVACANGKSGDALALVPELVPAVAEALAALAELER
jgi:HPt (histidine-containing phosphotransfer) domain-containing protein